MQHPSHPQRQRLAKLQHHLAKRSINTVSDGMATGADGRDGGDHAQQRHVAIVGATGVVGRAATEHFCSLPEYQQVSLVSRRPPTFVLPAATAGGGELRHLCVDLLDRSACDEVLGSLRGVTHLVYTAMSTADIGDPDYMAASIRRNTAMLANTLEPLLAVRVCDRPRAAPSPASCSACNAYRLANGADDSGAVACRRQTLQRCGTFQFCRVERHTQAPRLTLPPASGH